MIFLGVMLECGEASDDDSILEISSVAYSSDVFDDSMDEESSCPTPNHLDTDCPENPVTTGWDTDECEGKLHMIWR